MHCHDPRLIDLLFEQAKSSSRVSALAALATFGALAYYGTNTALSVWVLATAVIAGGRALALGRAQGQPLEIRCQLHRSSGILSAASWGALTLVPAAHLPPHLQAVHWVVPMLIATVALPTYAIMLHHYRDFLISLSATALLGLFATMGSAALSLTPAYLLFGPLIYLTGKRYHNNLIEAHQVTQSSQATVEQLQAANRALEAQQDQINTEEEIARHVFAQLTLDDEKARGIHTWNQAMGSLSGDLIQVARGPAGQTYVFLGDFTGHGLPAALGAVPASTVFRAMADKGLDVAIIARELNKKLHSLLPTGYFCCAAIMELSADRSHLKVWNGGLPPLVIRHGGNGRVSEVPADNLPLGVIDDDSFTDTCSEWSLHEGDLVFAYSDGVTEAENIEGEMWGRQRFMEFLGQKDIDGPRLEALKHQLLDFTNLAPASDDISIIEIEASPKAPQLHVA